MKKKQLISLLCSLGMLVPLVSCKENKSQDGATNESSSNLIADASNVSSSDDEGSISKPISSSSKDSTSTSSTSSSSSTTRIYPNTPLPDEYDGYVTNERSFTYNWSYSSNISDRVAYITGLKREHYNNIVIPDYVYISDSSQSGEYKVIGVAPDAFNDYPSIKSIQFNKFIQYIPSSTYFQGLDNLENIYVDNDNPYFYITDNCIFSKEDDAFYYSTRLNYIPEGIKKIGMGAFFNSDATFLTIPDSVEEIYPYTFANSKHLKEIILPNNLKKIGNYAFSNCTALKSIIIPDSCEDISFYKTDYYNNITSLSVIFDNGRSYTGTFSNCTSLKEINIPSSVTSIHGAFAGCTSLKNVKLPDGLKNISGAFSDCTSLERIIIPNSVTTWNESGWYDDGVFANCKSLKEVNIPDGVTDIENAFSSCTSLETITIPSSVTSISGAFEGCKSLKTVNSINAISDIGKRTFKDCSSLTTINLANTLTNVKDYAFDGCESLDFGTISIENDIGKFAFRNCKLLKTVNISKEIEGIGSGAFINCTSLTSINKDNKNKNEYFYIHAAAFKGCTSLENINIPGRFIIHNPLDESDKKLFDNNYGVFANCTSLKKIVIPSGSTLDDTFFTGLNLNLLDINYDISLDYYNTNYDIQSNIETLKFHGTLSQLKEFKRKLNQLINNHYHTININISKVIYYENEEEIEVNTSDLDWWNNRDY